MKRLDQSTWEFSIGEGKSAMEREQSGESRCGSAGTAEVDTRDPEEIAKEAAENAGGVFLEAAEYVAMVEELDELKNKVESLEAKAAQDAAMIETLQASMKTISCRDRSKL